MLIPKVIRPRNHPFPFLLYLEWALLGLAILNEFTPRPLPQSQEYSIFIIAIILSFGILGLRIPTHPLSLKLTYEILQFGLVALAGSLSIFKVRLLLMLYIVVILRSCLIFPLRGRLVVTALSFLGFMGMAQIQVQMFRDRLPPSLVQELLPQIVAILLNIMIMFLLLLVFLLWLINALLAERQQQDQLREANQKLKDAVAQIEKLAMAQERTSIAQEIHDALGHALTGLNIQLEGALKLWEINPEQSKELVAQAKKMGSMALNETRQAVASLREAPLQERQDLLAAIAPLLQDFEQMTGIMPHVTLDAPPLSPPLRLALYRIVQESLTNICKYAQADRVEIAIEPITERLLDSPSPQHYLALTVQDNGVGFHPEHNTTGFGLQGIRERAIAAGGTAEFISAPGKGCTVKVCLPMNN
ncbi:sensor histidine kinase [Roseofilum sp. BLCC_M91]|uniref:Oxygen sensor histidine kinase NreB n=1 Tax=Roseofilum halophilum BLCC-M91 TaxID=3022259 RepID=A0ABT7BEL8_9CYAN|nr:sensor histidine kinase [Roseofilum halophilum]MDJ1177611.1 sensor histidine kinase [Roseofilum halophilum BLCC-M91]